MVRHFTATGIVFNDRAEVLLIHHNKLRQWLAPGGHLDPNEDPAEAVVREVWEETGIRAEVITDDLFTHPAVASHAPPQLILEEEVTDKRDGRHKHIDMIFFCRQIGGELHPQLAEVSAAAWVPIGQVAQWDTPPEKADLVAYAARWAGRPRRPTRRGHRRPA